MSNSAKETAAGTRWPELDTWVNSLAMCPTRDEVAMACIDRTIRRYNALTQSPLCEPMRGHTNAARSITYTPDGRFIVSGSDEGVVRIWDTQQDGKCIKSWQAHKGAVRAVAVSNTGRLIATGGDDCEVRLYDLKEKEPLAVQPKKTHIMAVSSVAFNSSGNVLATGDESGVISLWVCKDMVPKLAKIVKGPMTPVTGIVQIPGTVEIIASCGDATIRRWSLSTMDQVGKAWEAHSASVQGIHIMPCGKRLVSGGQDAELYLWDIERGVVIGDPWKGTEGTIETIAADPKGRIIISGGANEIWTWLIQV